MNLESVKEESREIFIEFTNGLCEAMALGKKTLTSIVNDAMRLQWLSGIVSRTADVAEAIVVRYGSLYNWYAVSDARAITPVGWHIPTDAEWAILINYGGGELIAGGHLKETGTNSWTTQSNGCDNSYSFNARGSGQRNYLDGSYSGIKTDGTMWSSTPYYTVAYRIGISATVDTAAINATNLREGLPIRSIKDSTTLTHGQVGTYTQNDGFSLPTICIGTQEWTSCNLAETKFRNGDLITKVSDATAWGLLDTGGYCSYDNDDTNSFSVTAGSVRGEVLDAVDNDTPTLAIEKLRHYRGKYQSVDLSQIGVVTNPSAPVESISDLIRSGSQIAVIGANTIVFSSPLSTENYTVNVWIIGTEESQYDLGDISRFPTGFTVSDAVIEGTLYYQAIKIV